MIKLEDNMCCGCGACADACKVHAITMQYNDEGFAIPVVDRERCVECGRCETVCPIQNSKDNMIAFYHGGGYIAQHRDNKIRQDSTSGGGFTALAEAAITQMNAKVYGAAFNDQMVVEHVWVEDVKGLKRFRNSKYVQSKVHNVYSEISAQLNAGETVLFSGTPCQVAAVKRVFGEHPDLILVEVMCREVVSPLLLHYYIESKGKKIEDLRFRDKTYGYHYSVMKIKYSDAKVYKKALNYDQYLRAFFSNLFARKSCYDCQYRDTERVADITIWDAWDIRKYSDLHNDDLGATKVLINSEKGDRLFKIATPNMIFVFVGLDELLGDTQAIRDPLKVNNLEIRNQFYKIAETCGGKEAFDRYFPITIKTVLRNNVKNCIYLIGKRIKG